MKSTAYTLWSLDVWGSYRDGFEVNDRSCLSRAFPISHTGDSPDDAEVLQALFDADYLNQRNDRGRLFTYNVDGDDEVIEVKAGNGRPLLTLERNEGGAE